MSQRIVQIISGRLSLRTPQRVWLRLWLKPPRY